MTLSSIRIAVVTVPRSRSASSPSAPTCVARLTEPRLQTAVSPSAWPGVSARVFSVISVQRFDECTTPTCCCGERRLHASLKVIQGWPVSKSAVSIRRHSSTARTRRNTRSSPRSAAASYSAYRRENACPTRSCRSGTSSGENRVHVASASTRRKNSSGIQLAVFMSCVRRRSSPVFFLRSRNSSMSTCQVSRYAQAAPLRLPPWFTATAVSLAIFRNGTTPEDRPLVPLMCAPIPRTGRPVVAQPAGELGEQRVVADRAEDPAEIVVDRGEEARGQLRPCRARVEQRRRGVHEVETGEQAVELDRPALAIGLADGEAHRHTHEERLRQLVSRPVLVQEVAVVQRLQAEEAERCRPARPRARRPARRGRSRRARARAGRARCRGRRSARSNPGSGSFISVADAWSADPARNVSASERSVSASSRAATRE